MWSRARRNIRDWRRARQKETLGVGLALFIARAIRLCLSLGIKFSVENPQSSRLWEFGPINDILVHRSVFLMTTHMCAWGMPCKKPTSIMTNLAELLNLQTRCKGGHVHEQLRGSQTVEINGKKVTRHRAAAAGAYPRSLCESWAQIARSRAPDAGCGRASCKDVGLFLAALEAQAHRPQRCAPADASGDVLTSRRTAASSTSTTSGSTCAPTPSSSASSTPTTLHGSPATTIAGQRRKRKPRTVPGGGQLPEHLRLRAQKVSQKTLAAYYNRIRTFEDWARRRRQRVTKANLDKQVTSCLTWLSEGEETDPSAGAYLVYGLQLLRCSVPKNTFLVNAKEALAGWRKQMPGRMRAPVPEEFIFDLATHAFETGHLDITMAILLLYDTYLRPSECLGLTLDHLAAPQGQRYKHWAIVVAPSALGETTKTGEVDDSVLVADLGDRDWLRQALTARVARCSGPLFPKLTLSRLEQFCKKACRDLLYKSCCVMPHILRHSGASNDVFHKRRKLEEVQKRGRWQEKCVSLREARFAAEALARGFASKNGVH